MYHKTIHENDCGNCRHWHQWAWERECEHWEKVRELCPGEPHTEDGLHFGDCDKIAKGTLVSTESSNGEPYDYTFDGYAFEDECYDEDLHCFEGKEGEDGLL